MKRVTILTLLLMAFVSFATMESFADNSPPGVEISISYELPQGIDVNFESKDAQAWEVLQKNLLNTGEGRIAVYHCDLKCWPIVTESKELNFELYYKNALVNELEGIQFNYVTENNSSQLSRNNASNQDRLSVDKNEVLSLFYNSNGDRHSARNEVTKI